MSVDRCEPAACRNSGTTTSCSRSTRRGSPAAGQAEAVHPHRSIRVHHVRGLRRHLPVEMHPHGAPDAIDEAIGTEQPGRRPDRQRDLHDRRRRVHPVRAVCRSLPDRRHHPRQDRRSDRRRRLLISARTPTATATGCVSAEPRPQETTTVQRHHPRRRTKRDPQRAGQADLTDRCRVARRGTPSSGQDRSSARATATARVTAST